MITAELRPRGPYSLRVSGVHASDATRFVSSIQGTYTATIAGEDGLERVHAWQRPDGVVCVRAQSEAGVEHVRFVTGLEDDHSEFLERFADDSLLAQTITRMSGFLRGWLKGEPHSTSATWRSCRGRAWCPSCRPPADTC